MVRPSRVDGSRRPGRVDTSEFKSLRQAQRFVTARAAVYNLFNLRRYLIKAKHHRNLRVSAFAERSEVFV